MKKFVAITIIAMITLFGHILIERDYQADYNYDRYDLGRKNCNITTSYYTDDETICCEDIEIGDHWRVMLYTDIESYTGSWWISYDGRTIWFDKDFDGQDERSVESYNYNVLQCYMNYDGMDEREVQFYLSCVEGA